jgi:hypothetical protein
VGCSTRETDRALEGSPLSKRPFSKKQEERLLKAAEDVFLNSFPNPERKGCPDSETIKAVATGKLSIEEEDRWIDHFTSCSPCTRDFAALRREFKRRQSVKTLATAAMIIFICVAAWLVVRARRGVPHEYAAAYDLSTRLMLRGFGGGTENKGPMVLRRGIADLTLYLPPGALRGGRPDGISEGANYGIWHRGRKRDSRRDSTSLGLTPAITCWRYDLLVPIGVSAL